MRRLNNHSFNIIKRPDETASQALARFTLDPIATAAATLEHFDPFSGDGADFMDLLGELERSVGETLSQDRLDHAQTMLAAQARALNGIFHALAARSAANIGGGYIDAAETCLKLAFKAQSQCRATLVALSEIRNPKLATVVNQSNVAAGHQQVNNYLVESDITPNKLLEEQRERMDFGEAPTASGKDSTLEALGAVNRPQKRSRKKPIVDQCPQGSREAKSQTTIQATE